MKHTARYMLLVTALLALPGFSQIGQTIHAQEETVALKGPILAGYVQLIDFQAEEPAFQRQLAFLDVGTDRVWSYDSPDVLFMIVDWSPNGCQLLVALYGYRNDEDGVKLEYQWATMSIVDLAINELPIPGSTSVFWHPDGKFLTAVSRDNTTKRVEISLMNAQDHEMRPLFSLAGEVHVGEWLSDTELVYEYRANQNEPFQRFVWEMTTQQSRPSDPGYKYELPENWYAYLYRVRPSPDGQVVARFFDRVDYENMTGPAGIGPGDELATAEAAPRRPGFDLFFRNDGTVRHVDFFGLYVNTFSWSPNSQQIVITTPSGYGQVDPPHGVYVYDVPSDSLRRVSAPTPVTMSYEGVNPFHPAWSPDGQWLTLFIQDGRDETALMHHVPSGEQVILEVFSTREGWRRLQSDLIWSPVMDYSASPCATREGSE